VAVILNIESSTTNCSVSLGKNGEETGSIELNAGFSHAENIHVFIQQLLTETKTKLNDLNAIALSGGPGSYTGLRIGTSTAKGLCYALKIPFISISTLIVLTENARSILPDADFYLPMMDARRMEIYTALYNIHYQAIIAPHARIIDEQSIQEFLTFKNVCVFGDGMPKCKSLMEKASAIRFIDNIIPSAKNMHAIAFEKFKKKQFENLAYFEPYYLKEYMFAQPKK
jgi:tRNA threonylcarbamoyladenosine biosynthesis protein TsaB